MPIGGWIALIWVGGMFLAPLVYRSRAGLPFAGRLGVFGPGGVGLGFMTMTILKAFAWPGVLVYWLISGRPEPRILFNEKALARQQQLKAIR